ncbi:hypothetical protein CCHR01_16917 [Colletotrichum chrysophilum]|uniref:Uncharacterized protein n=1 Tax=Colletotrichum chrysophilum TaxID=1836956 RepID=A0AAD9A3C6_9PEZI|nr:hypothetical protein CCHR01_16917 [Colletotrichum chrysophilum]
MKNVRVRDTDLAGGHNISGNFSSLAFAETTFDQILAKLESRKRMQFSASPGNGVLERSLAKIEGGVEPSARGVYVGSCIRKILGEIRNMVVERMLQGAVSSRGWPSCGEAVLLCLTQRGSNCVTGRLQDHVAGFRVNRHDREATSARAFPV